MTKTPAK